MITIRGNVLWVCNPSCGVIASSVAQLWYFQYIAVFHTCNKDESEGKIKE